MPPYVEKVGWRRITSPQRTCESPLQKHRLGTISHKQRRTRYMVMCQEITVRFPHLVVIATVPSQDVAAHEAAIIGMYKPSCNNIQQTFGVSGNAGDRPLCKMYKQGTSRFRATSRVRIMSQFANAQLGYRSDMAEELKNLQIRARIEKFHSKVELSQMKIHEQQLFMQPFSKLYWLFRNENVVGVGPLDIFLHTILLLRYASICPDRVDWQRAVDKFQTIDCVYNYINMLEFCPNYHCRIKVLMSLKKFARSKNRTIPKTVILRIHHEKHRSAVHAILNHILQVFRSLFLLGLNIMAELQGYAKWQISHGKLELLMFGITSEPAT